VKFPQSVIFLILVLLTACSGQVTPTIYIPATRAPAQQFATQISPTLDLEVATATSLPQPSPSPQCTSGLVFLEDLSIPDGMSVSPGEALDKRWLVQNNGTCNWDYKFGLQLIAGPNMGAQGEEALYPARSGTQAEIQIIFTAPQELGTHRSAWQARDPQGKIFGDPIFIEVTVENP
jgi:hypothetical protein